MKKKLLLCLMVSMIIVAPVQACDYDGDGIDDAGAYEEQEDGTWNWTALLSAGGTKTETGFGSSTVISQAPGYYVNSTNAEFGIVQADYNWVLPNGDTLPGFGDTNVTYASGNDFDADGVSDAVKFQNRCNALTLPCYRRKVRANMTLNLTDGTNAFTSIGTTETHLIGGGLDPLMIADSNADGIAEICYAKPKINNRRLFKVSCENMAGEIVSTRNVGRVYRSPLALTKDGEVDYFVTYQPRVRASETKFSVYPAEGERIAFTIDQVGTVLVGDWIGTDHQQVGVVADGHIHYYDPFTEASGTTPIPSGVPIDCYNSLVGSGEEVIMTSKKACQLFECGS